MGGGEQCGRGSWGCTDASTVSGALRFGGSANANRVARVWARGFLSDWRDGVPGPTVAAAKLPVLAGRVMRAASPAAIGFSEAVGSAATVRGLGLQVPTPLFPWFCLLYVFQFTHL